MNELITLIAQSILVLAVASIFVDLFTRGKPRQYIAKRMENFLDGKRVGYETLSILLLGLVSIALFSVAFRSIQTSNFGGFPSDAIPYLMIAVAFEVIVGIPLLILARQIESRRKSKKG